MDFELLKNSNDSQIKEWSEKFEKAEIISSDFDKLIESKTGMSVKNYIKSLKIDKLLEMN